MFVCCIDVPVVVAPKPLVLAELVEDDVAGAEEFCVVTQSTKPKMTMITTIQANVEVFIFFDDV